MSDQGSYLRLETKGRKSGKNHSVIVRFVTFEGKIVIFPQVDSSQDWVLNLAWNASVRVFHEGKIIEGRGSVRSVQNLRDPVLSAFMRKYGETTVKARYWGQKKYVEIEPTQESIGPDYDDLVYADLEAAFDGVAPDYDEHIYGNPINLWLRNRSLALLLGVFKPGETVVEVGCGTGTETLSLARHGIRVLACDLSSKMLQVLTKKAAKEGLEKQVIPIYERPYLLKKKMLELGYGKIDGGFCTYGAINTDPKLELLFSNLHDILRSHGKLVLGVWNRYCLYEMLGYSLRVKPSMAVARFRNPVPIGKSRFCISTNAYTPRSLGDVISRYFKLDSVRGVGILLPPSNLTRYLPPPSILAAVKKLDVLIEGAFPWNRLGDHFLGTYTRVD